MLTEVYHFSENPHIARFIPHVPRTNPTEPAAVWAIDAEHAPLNWFPRDCPRVTAWAKHDWDRAAFARAFETTALRFHAIETGWLTRFRQTVLYRYTFDAAVFVPWPKARGQYVATTAVEPTAVVAIGNLDALHQANGIELRSVDDLWPLHDVAEQGPWDFSIVRMRNAQPRRR